MVEFSTPRIRPNVLSDNAMRKKKKLKKKRLLACIQKAKKAQLGNGVPSTIQVAFEEPLPKSERILLPAAACCISLLQEAEN